MCTKNCSESVSVSQSFLTICNPMDYSLCPWTSPGKNTGVGSHSLLQGISLTQGSNPSPTFQADSLPSGPPGKPLFLLTRSLKGFPGGSEGKASACNAGYPASIPGSGRSPGKGNGNPLCFSTLYYIINPKLLLIF